MTDTERLQIAIAALGRIRRNQVDHHDHDAPLTCDCSWCIARYALEEIRRGGQGVKHG